MPSDALKWLLDAHEQGRVPSSWSLLTRLQQLDLSSNTKVIIDSIPSSLSKQLECPGCTAMERLLEEPSSATVPKMWLGPEPVNKEEKEESGAEKEVEEEKDYEYDDDEGNDDDDDDDEEEEEEGRSSEADDADYYMDGADYVMDDYSLDYEFPASFELFPVDSRGVVTEDDKGGLVIDQGMLIALCIMGGVLSLVIITTSWLLCKGRAASKNSHEAVPLAGGGVSCVATQAPRGPSATPLPSNSQQRSKGSSNHQGRPLSSAARPPPQSGVINVVTTGGAVRAFPPRHHTRYNRGQGAMLRASAPGPLTRYPSPHSLSSRRERESRLRQSSNQPRPSSLLGRREVATNEGHKQIRHQEAAGPYSSPGLALFAAASQHSLDMQSPRTRWAGNDVEYSPSDVTDETVSLKAADSPSQQPSHVRSLSIGESISLEWSSNSGEATK